MKISYNSTLINAEDLRLSYSEFSLSYSSILINFWVANNTILYWEDTYFQLMASMRKTRLPIPLHFTPEYLAKQIKEYIVANKIEQGSVSLQVGLKSSHSSEIYFLIASNGISNFYDKKPWIIDIYKEITIAPNLLSAFHFPNILSHITQQYVLENDLNDLILLNTEKGLARSMYGNFFLLTNNQIKSNSEKNGALLSVLKKNFIHFLKEKSDFQYSEEQIAPYETQNAEELFIVSDKLGMISVTQSKKRSFDTLKTSVLAKQFIGYSLSK